METLWLCNTDNLNPAFDNVPACSISKVATAIITVKQVQPDVATSVLNLFSNATGIEFTDITVDGFDLSDTELDAMIQDAKKEIDRIWQKIIFKKLNYVSAKCWSDFCNQFDLYIG